MKVVYKSSDIRVIVTDALPTTSPYREVVGEKIRIWRHYYWPPLDFDAEILVYPTPRTIEARHWWEPEWTFVCDLEIKSATATTVVAVLNEVIHEIIRVIPVPAQRWGCRRAPR